MDAQRRQRGKPQYAGPYLRFSGCAGRRFVRLSLLPCIQIIPAKRLKCPLIRFFARLSSGLAFYALFRSLSPFVLGLVLRNPTSYKTIYYGHMQHHLRENTREQDDISILGGYFL